MFFDDDCLYDEDSGNESPEDWIEDEQEDMDDGEADDFGIDMEPGGSGGIRPGGSEEKFCFEVRTISSNISSLLVVYPLPFILCKWEVNEA